MSDSLRRLPDAELEVMQAVWQCTPPVSRADIEKLIAREQPMAPTTLLTLLTRLADRGFVRIEKNGRSSVYYPLVSREKYLASQSSGFVKKLCGGSMSVFANALCDSGLSREELAELRELLERRAL